jgi:hypothetical protein
MTGGVGGITSNLYDWNSYQGYDDAFWTKGTHSIKFGVAVERMLYQVTAPSDTNGVWSFTDLQSFLTNNPSKFSGGIETSLTGFSPGDLRDLRQTLVGGYLQDDWRWRANLTLNLGLRYEMTTVPTEIHGRIANLRNITDATPHLGDPFFKNPTTKNFDPRIGFAWDPFHNGKMAVRGGVGLFDVLPLPYQYALMTTHSVPFFQYTSLKAGDSSLAVPLRFFVVPPADITSNSSKTTYIDNNPKRTYVTQWNLNLQYQLTPNLAAMIAYVGSRGVHQPFKVDEANLVIPTLTSAGYVWPQVDVNGNLTSGPNAGLPPNKINPFFGGVEGAFFQGRSYFDALELQLAKRMSHGFQVQGTFTWGKSIDTSSGAGNTFDNSISSPNWFAPALNRGLSDFNVGRTLVVNGTWNVPTPKSFSGPARWLVNGWELGLIFTASDGVPFTPTWGTGGDPANTLSSDDFAYPNRLGGPSCQTLTNPGNPNNYIKTECFAIPTAPTAAFFSANCDQQPPSVGGPPPLPLQCFNLRGNAGRNIMIGPGISDLDFSVFKNNHIERISEYFNVQFRVEIFNLLNHANFAPPGPAAGNTDIFGSNGTSLAPSLGGNAGVLIKTTIPERQIQFAMKIIF